MAGPPAAPPHRVPPSPAAACSAGADPFAKDLNGVSVEQVARFSPETLALVHKAQGRHQQNAELVGGGPCWNCGKTGASRRCQACLCALYCDRTCQRQHWKQHKKSCGSSSASGSGSGAAAGASGAGQPVRLLRLRPAQASPYVATIPHRAMAQQVAAAWGMTEGEPRPLAEAADLRGPAEQAAAAARLNEKLFMIKAQVRAAGCFSCPAAAGVHLFCRAATSHRAPAPLAGGQLALAPLPLMLPADPAGQRPRPNAHLQQVPVLSGLLIIYDL